MPRFPSSRVGLLGSQHVIQWHSRCVPWCMACHGACHGAWPWPTTSPAMRHPRVNRLGSSTAMPRSPPVHVGSRFTTAAKLSPCMLAKHVRGRGIDCSRVVDHFCKRRVHTCDCSSVPRCHCSGALHHGCLLHTGSHDVPVYSYKAGTWRICQASLAIATTA
jgi:hypothetical protein